jgi:CRISPR-associated endonuclease/helicase Cas3
VTEVAPDLPDADEWKGYPLLSLAKPGMAPRPVPIPKDERDTTKTVQLRHLTLHEPALPADLLEEIEAKVAMGFCVLIIRNTVPLAQATYRQVKPKLCQSDEAEQVGLLHSRFPFYQRFGHPDRPGEIGREARWVARLGKNREKRPKGCVVVSTQVCEMSVDIDADWLITDLCPTDQLLQRIGRLHRHTEPRCAEATQAETVILHPAPPEANAANADDWKKSLRPHGILYAPYVLLRTQAVWQRQNAIILPGAIRDLLRDTYSPAPESEDSAWKTLWKEMDDEVRKLTTAAEQFSRDRTKPASKDEEHFAPTRWNDLPTLDLLLLKAKPEMLPGGSVKLSFLADGECIWSPGEKWQDKTAKHIFINSLRIPAYLWPKSEIKPDWLADYSHGLAGAAWVQRSGALISCDGETELPLRYCHCEGVVAVTKPKTKNLNPDALLDEEEQEGMG